MKKREFLGALGGAAVIWPAVTQAQQMAMPVVGLLDQRSPEMTLDRMRGFHRGLKEVGYVEGENVAIVYRWAENQNERLPELVADLVRRQVSVIAATGGTPAAFAAQAATTRIPVVFAVPEDPVRINLVASLARPDRNLTGINFLNLEVGGKRLELLRELIPTATRIAVLVNPANEANAAVTARDVQLAASAMGLQVKVYKASTSHEIDLAFAVITGERPDALYVGGDGLFNSRRLQLAMLAARHALPASYTSRDYPVSGGLMSYGADLNDTFRQVGTYVGHLLKGAKPSDFPVLQSIKFEFVINHQTARLLGLTVPPTLLARADEVIE